MRVFVTGGSGFVGRRLVSSLIDGGHEVVCLSRSGQTSAQLDDLGAHVLSGDLTDADSIAGCVREAAPTHVAHLAAETATQRNRDRIEAVNVGGTKALIDACRDTDIEKFLFLSSVIRGSATGQTFTEEDEIPATTDYGRSKARGDEMVLEAHKDWGLPAVILRPSHIYGAGGWLEDLIKSKLFRIPGTGDNLWDLVHVDDVVSACETLLEEAAPGEVFHVVDDEPTTMRAFFDRVAAAADRPRPKNAPVWLAKITRGSGTVTAATRSAKSTNAKLKQLGWKPQHPKSSDEIATVIREILGIEDSPEGAPVADELAAAKAVDQADTGDVDPRPDTP